MGKGTGIQWCDDTCNCTSGCDGCELWKLLEARADGLRVMGGPCYAGNLQEKRLSKSLPHLYSRDFTEVRMIPGRMAKAAAYSDLTGTKRPNKPWLDNLPRVIFVDDLGDLFSKAITFEFIKQEVIDTALGKKGSRHIWMLLTKQPRRMAEFCGWLKDEHSMSWPDNVWAGTSITTQATTSRIRHLLDVRAKVRFLSVEPQWTAIDLHEAFFVGSDGGWEYEGSKRQMINLVIQGGESDQGEWKTHPFDVEWARAMRDECKRVGIPYLLKQLGSRPYDSSQRMSIDGPGSHSIELDLYDHHGGDPSEWPVDLRDCRQMPEMVVAGMVGSPEQKSLFA